jgi:hypothetical protein
MIAVSEKLCAENSGARHGPEYREIENENKLIDDRDACHRLGANPTDHYIVEQVDEV